MKIKISLVVFSCFLGAGALAHISLTTNKFHESKSECGTCHPLLSGGEVSSDRLILLTGESVEEEKIPVLCAQCHGIAKRDWDKNIHGKRSAGRQLKCNECHNPHSPHFAHMKADPAPPKPKGLILKESHNVR